jgi:hypothetical protein
MSLVTIPEAARILRRSPEHLRLFCFLVGVGLAVGAVLWGGFLIVALPRGFGHWLLPRDWRQTYPLVLPLTISVLGGCFIGGATAGLHALGVARRSLRAMVLSAALLLACSLAGAAVRGAVGTMEGTAVATWIGAGLWWWQLRTAMRDAGITRADKFAQHAPASVRRSDAVRWPDRPEPVAPGRRRDPITWPGLPEASWQATREVDDSLIFPWRGFLRLDLDDEDEDVTQVTDQSEPA